MRAYGEQHKRRNKRHPHNECSVCGEQSEPIKKRARQEGRAIVWMGIKCIELKQRRLSDAN